MHSDDGFRVRAIESGACHFLSKDCYPKGMLAIIKNCHESPPHRIRRTLQDLVETIVMYPDQVAVIDLDDSRKYNVKVAWPDYELVLSKIDAIRTLASCFAEIPESQGIFIQVTPV